MHKALLIALCLTLPSGALFAQDNGLLPPNVIFVTSTGFWEESGGAPQPEESRDDDKNAKTAAPGGRRGYYKLIAVRQEDGTAQVHLQQIASTPTGPEVVSSAELEEFTALKPYVTDIRPETSTGITPQPGMFATVYLKTEAGATEPETWTVLIDELGDIKIERATN
ncbi:hypothetical protein [Sinorhizobium prairiense]|uniref:hypothetical protein n=1 Tax=unclassified Sinorhizobium TaxID=2613772 RepID=UPI0023D875DD|nr:MULTISPECIES: hypothetical protein [unclassified Sinorhizobium]WEJ11249.1 hypothetical protein N0Q90_09200 [Sinorhizobium sp. M103]WEJ17038.1 hypothetical protein N0Q91_11120 [Sinorhizobium sp. K101]WEJ38235.1 hypothetical protein N0R80_09170 [Sinorhizobium sp. C101]